MPKLARLFLALGAIAFAGLTVLRAGGQHWLEQQGADLIDWGNAAISEGRASGARLDEGGCLNSALERHKADQADSISVRMKNDLWLSGCLQASKPQQQFCASVPPKSERVRAGIWTELACVRHGLWDSSCHSLFREVWKYCSSTERVEKLKLSPPK
jgi:hypothetical protein